MITFKFIKNLIPKIFLPNQKLIFWESLIFLLYIAITAFTTFHHEPWQDEVYVWFTVKYLSVPDIIGQMDRIGTPALWHFILLPFARLGFPYITMHIIHLVIAYFAVGIFLYKSPFPIITKIAFIFSYYMVYEYAVIARNYNISILLLFLIASLYENRWKKPYLYALFLFLLFQTNVFSCFVAGALSLVFFFEYCKEKKFTIVYTLAIGIAFLGGLVAFLQLLPPENFFASHLTKIGNNSFELKNTYQEILIILKKAFFVFTVSTLIYLLFFLYLWNISKKIFFILAFSHLGIFFVIIGIYPSASSNYRHIGFLLLSTLFSLWIALKSTKQTTKTGKLWNINFFLFWQKKKNKLVILAITISLLFSWKTSVETLYKDYKYDFSGVKKMAQYIIDSKLDQRVIYITDWGGTSFEPYLPRGKFQFVTIRKYSYNDLLKKNPIYPIYNKSLFSEFIQTIKQHELFYPQALFLFHEPISKEFETKYQLLYKVDAFRVESYYLYKIL